MKTSQRGIDLIKQFEGFRPQAYKDSVGIPTIGYGTIVYYETGKRVNMGDTITQECAECELERYVYDMEKKLGKFVLKLNQNQYDAVCSFAYNLGVNALNGSTLAKKAAINPNDTTIYAEFMKWINAGGKPVQGLINRRKQEADLYFLKNYGK